MPNRNHSRYLPRALDAIRAQTWTKLQIIVIDDASTDVSRDVIEAYAKLDERVELLALLEHVGINGAVTAGLAHAKGEYIYVAAADDFVEPSFVERCLTEMRRHPEAGVSFSDPTEFHELYGRTIQFPLYLSDKPTFFDRERLLRLFKRNYFHISPNTGLYRTAAFQEAGSYRAALQWWSDWFVTTVVALRWGACYLPEHLTHLTVRSDSYSAVSLRDAKAQAPLLEHFLGLLAMPQYADVARRMQQAGLLPEYHLRTLWRLVILKNGRKFVRPRLVIRILAREGWSLLRPMVPPRWRRRLRQAQSVRTRVA